MDYQLLFIPSATSQPRRLNANLMHLLLWPITLAAANITIWQRVSNPMNRIDEDIKITFKRLPTSDFGKLQINRE